VDSPASSQLAATLAAVVDHRQFVEVVSPFIISPLQGMFAREDSRVLVLVGISALA
jgi:hypothetical protein